MDGLKPCAQNSESVLGGFEISGALDNRTKDLPQRLNTFPPSPPATAGSQSSDTDSRSGGQASTDGDLPNLSLSKSSQLHASFPLPPPSIQPEVLDIDKATPDFHVPRDPRLIRLTGVHPLNVEPPLATLFDQGFLTPPELFYVRNHGAVPQVADVDIPDWTFEVSGLVETPMTLTLKSLLHNYPIITAPITLVCAGNRRKEQNVVRKSKGFSWGAAGLSTALFTGVLLCEVLKIAKPKRKAKYVCMEGADELPNGSYGTSLKLSWAMDEERGIMLSHMMNGEMLRPDHGKPLRVVVPGQIGGRSVKWLKKLVITDKPSDNWYHIYDNRVLPTMVTPEKSANEPKWWMDERYAIYDLSTNSAICYPQHEEHVGLNSGPDIYRCRGYAYSGGGRRIGRVELSIDQGKNWRLAEIEYPEDRYRDLPMEYTHRLYGGQIPQEREASFCWCFWHLDIEVSDLATAKDLLVRAMDESMNLQPRDMYWSVLGMMNNPWFRVAISKEGGSLRFEHPTQPALLPGGWMERVKKADGDLTNGFWGELVGRGQEQSVEKPKEVPMTKGDLRNIISLDEFRKHDATSGQDPWFVVRGEVYDGTAFLKEHPGGRQSIISAAGLDSTDEFMAIHSETAKAMMPSYHIGTIDTAASASLTNDMTPDYDPALPRATFLNNRTWTRAVLHTKRAISWDTRIFTFSLEHSSQTLGLPIGQHLMIRLRDPVTQEVIIRSYTPISAITKQGFLHVLVKVYFDTEKAKGGKMSQAMDRLPLGAGVDFKGPIGKFEYLGRGRCCINSVERSVGNFVMICGGSGITPVFQVFRAVMEDKEDKTHCVVLNGNRMVEDILCREDLDALLLGNEDRAKVVHTLTQGTETWNGLRGRINGQLVKQEAVRNEDTLALICGPESLEKSIHKALLADGWRDEQLLFF